MTQSLADMRRDYTRDGLTEAQARDRFDAIDVYRSSFRALKHTLTDGAERTLMKLIVDRESDRVVGLHMVGPEAGEPGALGHEDVAFLKTPWT